MAKSLKIVAIVFLLNVSVCFTTTNREALLKKFMATAVACQKEVGATASDIDDIITKHPAASMEGKCLRACVLKKFNLLNADGKFKKAAALKLSKKILKDQPKKLKISIAIIEACADIPVADNACVAAEQYAKCFKKQAVAHGVRQVKCYLYV